MSRQAVDWVFQNSRSKGAARLVLLALADHHNEEKGYAWPSVSRLAQWTQLTERGVRLALRTLEKDHAITTTERGAPGGSNKYVLSFTPEHPSPLNGVPPGTNGRAPGKPRPKTPEQRSAELLDERVGPDPRGTFLPGTGWVPHYQPRRLQAVTA